MALTWEWSEKCGEITLEQKTESGDWRQFPLSLYKGNAFLIMLAENDEDNTYQMFGFFADKEHAKACLGLARSKARRDTGSYRENNWARIMDGHELVDRVTAKVMDMVGGLVLA